jgi:hypothetical protein
VTDEADLRLFGVCRSAFRVHGARVGDLFGIGIDPYAFTSYGDKLTRVRGT